MVVVLLETRNIINIDSRWTRCFTRLYQRVKCVHRNLRATSTLVRYGKSNVPDFANVNDCRRSLLKIIY